MFYFKVGLSINIGKFLGVIVFTATVQVSVIQYEMSTSLFKHVVLNYNERRDTSGLIY